MVRAESQISDYEPIFAPLRAARLAASGKQLGDPQKAAAAILQLIAMDNPAVHLLLGSDEQLVGEDRARTDAEFKAFDALSRSTDLPTAHRSRRDGDTAERRRAGRPGHEESLIGRPAGRP